MPIRITGWGEVGSTFYVKVEMVLWLPFLTNPLGFDSGLGQVTSWASLLGLGLHQARGLKLMALGLSGAYRHVSFGARILVCFVIKFESLCTGLPLACDDPSHLWL